MIIQKIGESTVDTFKSEVCAFFECFFAVAGPCAADESLFALRLAAEQGDARVQIGRKRPVWPPYCVVFHGNRSSTRLILQSGMRASVSASQAWGSMPFNLAVSTKV